MGTPITWRNIDVNPVGEISRAMTAGQIGVNLGFDSFNKVLDRYKATDEANWNQEKTNKNNAYMNDLAAIQTPEELAAARGRLEESIRAGGAQIDQPAARQALGAQLGLLQDRIVKNQAFQQGQQQYSEKDLRDHATALIAEGKTAEGMAFAKANGIHDLAPLQKTATEVARNLILQGRTDETYGREKQIADATLPETLAVAKDTTEARAADVVANRLATEYKAANEKARLDITGAMSGDATLSKFLKDGKVAMEEMDSKDIKKANEVLKEKGLPTLDVFQKGDVAAAQNIEKRMQEAGHSAKAIASVLGKIPSLVSTAPTASFGNDAATAAYKRATADELAQQNKEKYGQVATPDNVQELSKVIDEYAASIENTSTLGFNTRENIVKAANKWIQEKGIEGPDGLRILPSAGQLGSILRTTDRSMWSGDESDVNAALDAWAKRSKSGAAAVIKDHRSQQERNLKAKLYPVAK